MHPQIIKKEPGNCPICGMKLTPIRANGVKAQPGSATSSGERKIKYYKSTMTPGEVKPGPGKDSMGMDMVPVYEDEDASADNKIQIDAATTQRMNLKTALVEHGPVRRDFRTVGVVAYNESGLRDITTKYEGWIEKLYVNTTGALVKAGDPLFDIYSPDLYNAQLNYLLALRTEASANGRLTHAALTRLQLFDVPESYIEQLKQAGEVQHNFVYHAPTDGVVIEKMAFVGQMMKPGERLFRFADLSSVWVQAQIYEKDISFVHEGQPALIRTSYGPERTFEGKVQLLLPQVQEQTRSFTARIVLPNADGFLRPGMFVDVSFSAQLSDDAVLVPDVAVLRSGERNTVFVATDGGFFEPREVRLGARSNGNFYEVLDGLKSGERIVISGQFMLDSESQLRDAIQKMLRPNGTATPPIASEHSDNAMPMNPIESKTKETPPKVASSLPQVEMDMGGGNHISHAMPDMKQVLYTCPMPEHADVVQDHPGKCTKCGMTLVPTTEVEHGKTAEENWRKKNEAGVPHVSNEPSSISTQTRLSSVNVVTMLRHAYSKEVQPGAEMTLALARLNASKSDETCGGCGMDAAAMAAGAECPTAK
jgi:multidrug efflux pump subunit AcrA (membrane-fusion protein)